MKTKKSFHKCIKCCIVFSLLILFSVNGYSQTTPPSDSLCKTIVRYPTYRGQPFLLAVKYYIENGVFFGSDTEDNPNLEKYHSEVLIILKKNGALKKARIVESTGWPELDKQILMRCRDFIRKRHVTPAYSSDGPEEYICSIPLTFEYYKRRDESQAKPIRYQSAGSYRGTTPYSVTLRQN